jgi:hypothetical protein
MISPTQAGTTYLDQAITGSGFTGTWYYRVRANGPGGSSAYSTSTIFTYLSLSRFQGTNGTAIASYTPDLGPSWTSVNAGLKLSSNTLVGTTSNDDNFAFVDVGQANVTHTCVFTYASGDGQSPIFRGRQSNPSNCWLVYNNGTQWILGSIISSSFTPVATFSQTLTNGQSYSVDIIYLGNTITVYIDGIQRLSYASASFNNTATQFGPDIYKSGGVPAGVVTLHQVNL